MLGLPASALCWLGISFLVALAMRRTTFGRWIYAVGANETAARLMGVPTRAVILAAYVLSSLLAVLGGLLVTAYIGNPSLGIGNQFLLASVVAVVVGGTALTGGVGERRHHNRRRAAGHRVEQLHQHRAGLDRGPICHSGSPRSP